MEMMDEYQKELDKFNGDKALFWAGKMAQIIKIMTVCSPMQLSGYLEILDKVREKYDQIIFSRLK